MIAPDQQRRDRDVFEPIRKVYGEIWFERRLPHTCRNLQALADDPLEELGRHRSGQRALLKLTDRLRVDRIREGTHRPEKFTDRVVVRRRKECALEQERACARRIVDRKPLSDGGSHRVADDHRRLDPHCVEKRGQVSGKV